jgi:hypothetical protein
MLTVPSLSQAQCYTLSSSTMERIDVGQLCFSQPPGSVGFHQFVDIRVVRGGVENHYKYYSVGVQSVRRCVHGREETLCHNAEQQVFGMDLGFGRSVKITLELPDLESGFAELGDGNYGLYPEQP